MFCPYCSTLHPDTANYCMRCGRPIREDPTHPDNAIYCLNCGRPIRDPARAGQNAPEWEYQQITVPLDDLHSNMNYVERYNQIVYEHVQRLREDGWQVDGPADWDSMWMAGRIKTKGGSGGLLGPRWRFESVVVRLRRPAGTGRRGERGTG